MKRKLTKAEKDRLKIESNVAELLDQFEEFCFSSDQRIEWLKTDVAAIYVRKSFRYIEDEGFIFLDIANVCVEPRFQNKGLFQKFLTEILQYDLNFYAEAICSKVSAHILQKFGFTNRKPTHFDITGIYDAYLLSSSEGSLQARLRLKTNTLFKQTVNLMEKING